MAASAEIIGEPLPEHWTYGVTADGRVFYIDDLHETTSWVHPVTNKPAASGLLSSSDLPSGWEWSITPEGVVYYVDHNTQRTTFIHPLTRKAAPPLNDVSQSIESQRPSSLKPVPQQQTNKKPSARQRIIDKGPEAQRMSNSKVILSGWLTVQESNSIRSWKRRWCVHADYGLFFYRDTTEQQCVGSILLPSYTIRPCDVSDPVNKRYAFKAEHANLRTQYFFAESRGNMDEWVRVLSQSAQMLNSESGLDKFSGPQRPASPENENEYYVLARDVAQNGELRYQRTTYPKEETPPEYYPIDRQPSVSSKEYSPYSNIPSSEYSYRNSYSPNHPSPTHPSSPRLFHSQQNASFGEATPNRNSYSSIGSPYNQRHDYSYKSAKPPERNPGSPPRPSPQRQSVSSSVSPYPDVTSSVAYSSLDFNAMYHNEHLGEHPSPPGSYQSIGSPHSLDSNSMTVPKTIEAESYSGPPPSQNALSHYSSNNLHSPESFRNHRNYSPLERGPDRDSYSSRGELDRSQLSYEMYLHNDSHGKDLPNLNLSQENFVLNHSDIAAPFSKRLSGAQTNLSKLAVDSDNGDQRSVDTESHQDYATICRIRSESMCTSPEMLRSRPASISASQHGSDTDVPKRTSIERLQEMHLRELQRHSHLSRSFSSGNVPNYHIISQTLSQEDDENGALQDAQSYGDDRKQEDPFFKRNSTSSQPQMEYQSGNRSLSPASELQNQIVYDYQGMGHDSTLPTHTSQGLSVKPQKYPSNVYLGQNGKPYNNYMNVKNRNSYSDFVNKTDSVELTSADMERDLYNMDYKQHSQSFERNDHHMSYDSASNIKPTGLAYNFMEPDSSNHSQHGSEISDAYINYQTASNLQSASGTPSERQRHQNGIHERNMNTVKEDPNMPDTAVIETVHPMFAKLNASQGRLRMSISAGDLLGKTHEELVLLLIQLRRNKTNLERCRESLRKQIDQLRPFEQEYKRQLQEANTVDFQLEDRHGYFMELKRQCGEVENKLEMYKPIENLVDNMVTMGSLYGGNNYMLATQYRKHILNPDEYIPPKKMIEFSRQHQEDVIIQKIEKDVRELTNDEADLEEKMERLCVLDRLIQEQSFSVTSLREDKEALEKTLRDIQYEQNRPSDRSQKQMEHLANQQHTVDKELSKAMLQLAEASKKLEELNAESSKLEHEIALLRSNVHGELNRSRSVPSLMEDPNHTRYKMEKDLHRVKDVMDNLSKEGARLSQALHTLKLPPEMNDEIATSNKQKPSTYMETDLDSKESYDLACETSPMFSPEGSSNLDYHEGHVGFVKYVRPSSIPSQLQVENNNSALASSPVLLESHREQPLHSQLPSQFKAGGQEVGVAVPVTSTLDGDISYEEENMWDISDADDNTKRFFGVSVPKLKRSPRGRNRYLTISSSEPIKLEHALQKQSSINSSAGDLIPGATFINNMPDIVSSTIDKFDEETIDRELMKPEMVFIPERYIPDCDEEDLTEEEKEKRRAKAEKIRKVLTEQSVHSWTKQIPAGNLEKIHDHIAKEKILREHLLTITQELAKEVTKKSKEAAGQNPSTVKTGKASHVTKGEAVSTSEYNADNSKTTKLFATSPEITTASITKLDPSDKPPSPKINSKLTLSVFQLLLADLVSESSSLMEFLAKSTCCTKLPKKDADEHKILQQSDLRFFSKKFPSLSACQSKLKAASLRILKNPPFFETEVTYSKFKKYPLFGLTKPPVENEGMKESVWKYLESLLKEETESAVQDEAANPVEIIPSLEALNLELGFPISKKRKPCIMSNSTPNLKDENSSLGNCLTAKPQESAFTELHPHSMSKEPLDSSPSNAVTQRPQKKITTPAVPLNCLFEENPQDLEDLEVFYRLAEEILNLNPTSV